MLKSKFLLMVGAGALGIAGLLAAAPAQAVVFDLTNDHCSSSCGTSPFGAVTLTQVGTTVDVGVSLFPQAGNPSQFVTTGAGGGEVFKFDFTGTVPPSVFTITSPTTPALQVDGPGSFDGDGTGTFNFGISCPSCGNGGAGAFAGPIDFNVTNATIAELTSPNSLGNVFVADILSGNGATGPVASLGPVPAPAIGHGLVVLLAVGGVLFGGKLWENLKKRQSFAA